MVKWVIVSLHVEFLLPLTETVQAVVGVVADFQLILFSTVTHKHAQIESSLWDKRSCRTKAEPKHCSCHYERVNQTIVFVCETFQAFNCFSISSTVSDNAGEMSVNHNVLSCQGK